MATYLYRKLCDGKACQPASHQYIWGLYFECMLVTVIMVANMINKMQEHVMSNTLSTCIRQQVL